MCGRDAFLMQQKAIMARPDSRPTLGRIRCPTLVLCGREDALTPLAKKAKAKPVNLAGQLSIKELGALTARASLFVGAESMPMHLARAMGTPTVALFGPSPIEAVHAALREPLTT